MKKIIKILALGVGLFFAPFVLAYVWEYCKRESVYIRTS